MHIHNSSGTSVIPPDVAVCLRDDYALSHREWLHVESLLPGQAGGRGAPARDNRLFLEAVLWLAYYGAAWRVLPPEYGRWNSVYLRFNRWCRRGVWDNIFARLETLEDVSFGIEDRRIVHLERRRCGQRTGLRLLPSTEAKTPQATFEDPGSLEALQAELRVAHSRIAHLTTLVERDPLTSLLNRRALFRLLEQAIDQRRRYNRKFCLFYIDIDNFKTVNDTYGHAMGDRLLQAIGKSLSAVMRISDEVVRIGGDEFAVLFAEAEEALIAHRAESIRQVVERAAMSVCGAEAQVGVSLGLTEVRPNDVVESVVERADRRMYEEKSARLVSKRVSS